MTKRRGLLGKVRAVKSPASSAAKRGRQRRLLGLALLLASPVILLTILGVRSLRYESLAVRERTVRQADEICEWMGLQATQLLMPELEWITKDPAYPNLERSALLSPAQGANDLILRLRANAVPGLPVQACLLTREGQLAYPEPDPQPGADGNNAAVADAHALSRELYRQFQQMCTDSAAANHVAVSFTHNKSKWIMWRVGLQDSSWDVLLAVRHADFVKGLGELCAPDREGQRRRLPPIFHNRRPSIPEFLQLVVLLDHGGLILHQERPADQVWTSMTTTRRTMMSELNWTRNENVIAQRGMGGWAFKNMELRALGGKRESNAAFRTLASIHDRGSLFRHVRQQVWLYGGMIGVALGGSAVALWIAARAYRRQEQLSAAKTNFISSVSHELRTPLASVRLMAESLLRGTIRDPEKQQEYFRLIAQESTRLSGLVENVLDVGRIEQGRKTYAFEPCDLARLFSATVASLIPYSETNDVRLESETLGEPRPVTGDAGAIQQVLVNLLDNAIKHSPRGATVKASLDFRETGRVALVVADAGPGVPARERERIFDPFHRLGSELRRETQGAGLGLAIVKHAVAAHGGVARVDDAPGGGARFSVYLPDSPNRSDVDGRA